VGDQIFFTVEGLDQDFTGRIYAFEPKIQAGTRTLRLRARTPNTRAALHPGAYASIELVFEEIKDAVAIPALAIIPELGGKKVFVYSQGKAEPRTVETGIRLEDRVQILSGLTPQDTIITSGLQQLRPGLPVQVVQE
jgi:membrane fusion protein (multidrug efflux system)